MTGSSRNRRPRNRRGSRGCRVAPEYGLGILTQSIVGETELIGSGLGVYKHSYGVEGRQRSFRESRINHSSQGEIGRIPTY
jgi:hypothetical protein